MSNEARKEYNTGAVRSSDCEEARYDLISPIGLRALARTYAEGARKFGPFNWENGMPAADLINHALTHIFKFLEGSRDEDDLGHAAWNILGEIHSLELWPHLNEDWLRGPNCAAPKIASAGAKPEAEPEKQPNISIEEVAPKTFAVDVENSEEILARLRKALSGG
jgi:hypothetical protein